MIVFYLPSFNFISDNGENAKNRAHDQCIIRSLFDHLAKIGVSKLWLNLKFFLKLFFEYSVAIKVDSIVQKTRFYTRI